MFLIERFFFFFSLESGGRICSWYCALVNLTYCFVLMQLLNTFDVLKVKEKIDREKKSFFAVFLWGGRWKEENLKRKKFEIIQENFNKVLSLNFQLSDWTFI